MSETGFLSSCTSGGCGAKIGPDLLARLLSELPVKADEKLLVGFGGSDDAAVYAFSADRALVSTVDFFSPMVEDPFLFGKIAAANALSDVYAMGGTPLFVLNLVCFPQKMDEQKLRDMLAGGAEKVREADAVIAGGHSIYDHEPKYGLAVTGIVDPQKILRNNTPHDGDALILTKALGVGLVMSAFREGAIDAASGSFRAAAASMERLNRAAAECLGAYPVHACTDVTGFGLLLHAAEMAGDAHTITLESGSLNVLPDAPRFAREGYITSGGRRNRAAMEGRADMSGVSAELREVAFDPQTSGGLLIAVENSSAAALLADIQKNDGAARIVGSAGKRGKHAVILRP
jgi:selenide,water dikinase